MPAQEVPRTDAPGPEDFVDDAIREPFTAALAALDMQTLSEASDGELPGLLSPLADAYEAWIAAQERRIDDPAARLAGYEEKARQHLAGRARDARRGSGPGSPRSSDPDVAEAFRFANHAMWQQRVHTLAGRGAPPRRLAEAARRGRGGGCAGEPVVAAVPARVRAAEPAGAGRPDAIPSASAARAWSTCCSSRPAAARPRRTSG